MFYLKAVLLLYCLNSMADTISVVGHGQQEQASPPHRWYDYCEETTKGIAPTVIRYLFKKHGHTASFYSTNIQHADYFSQLNSEIQLVLDQEVDFTPIPQEKANDPQLSVTTIPLISTNTVLVTHKQREFLRIKEINGYKGEITQFAHFLYRDNISYLTPYPRIMFNLEDSLVKLNNGKIDYIIAGEYKSIVTIRKLGIRTNFRIMDTTLPQTNFYLATKKGGPHESKIRAFDITLETMRKSGLIEMIHESNTSSWINNKNCALSL